MAHPYHHALSSMKKWGGTVDDFIAVHKWFDQSKESTAANNVINTVIAITAGYDFISPRPR